MMLALTKLLNLQIFARVLAGLFAAIGLSAPAAPDQVQLAGEPMQIGNRESSQELSQLSRMTLGSNTMLIGRGDEAKRRNALLPVADGVVAAMAPFSAIASGTPEFVTAQRCLSQAIYYEAANEPLSGQRAVAQVVLNRVRHPAYPSSVCDVVYEGWSEPVCQFSFVCDGALMRAPSSAKWQRAMEIARDALTGHVESAVGTSTHYHADYVFPYWALRLGKIEKVGRHLFYRFPGAGGARDSFRQAWNGREVMPEIDFSRFSNAGSDLNSNEEGEAFFSTAVVEPDLTDRHAPNDVGGRIDPSKGWTLDFPDPVETNSQYRQSLAIHAGGSTDRSAERNTDR